MEVIIGIIVVVVALNVFGDAVLVEAVIADLVLALLAGAGTELLAVGVGLAAWDGGAEGGQGVAFVVFDVFVHR